MDDAANSTGTGFMSMYVFHAVLLLLSLAIQTGVIASLPEPYRFFPLVLVMGVIVLHERSLVLGGLWLAIAGLILEVRGLGSGLAFASGMAAVAALLLAVFVFAKKSFWALIGVGIGTTLTYVIARLLWLLAWSIFARQPVAMQGLLGQSMLTGVLAVLGIFLFGAYIRRFLRWSRHKFVSKGQLYDISISQ